MFPILSCNERSRGRSTGALTLACACSCFAFGALAADDSAARPAMAAPATSASASPPLPLTLVEAEERTLSFNRDLKRAAWQVEGAQAALISAGARPNPTLSINSSGISPSEGIGAGWLGGKRIDNTVRIDQTIERGGKRDIRLEGARAGVEAARADLDNTERQQRLAVRSAYFDLLYARGREELAREAARLVDRLVAAAETRLKAGDLADADVARIQVDALRAHNDLRQAVAATAGAKMTLALLIGAEREAQRLQAADPWPSSNDPAVPELGTAALDSRPDVRAALMRIDTAEAALRLARSQRMRDVTLGMQVERFPTQSGNTVGFGVSIPLFLGNYFEGDIRRAETDRYGARDELDRTRAIAFAEAERARSELAAAADRLARFDASLLPTAARAAAAAEFAFSNGAAGVTDLLDSRRTLNATRLEALGARADFARALAAWRAAAGENAITGQATVLRENR